MSRRARAGLALVLAAALAGCGEAEVPAPPAPVPTPAPAPAPMPPEPPDAEAGDASRGAADYATFCASCHGVRGDADTPLAQSLDPPPARHSDGNYMNGLSDEYLARVIREGGAAVGKSPLMAPWGGTLTEEQIRDVVAYVRTLADPPYRP